MLHRPLISLLLLSLVHLPAGAAPETLTLPSRTSQVTAYQQQAQITREVTLNALQPGHYEIRIPDLPQQLYADSLTVTGSGTAKALVHHVELSPVKEPLESAELQQLIASITLAEQQLKQLSNQQTVGARQQELLDTLQSVSEEKIRKQLGMAQFKTGDWETLLGFVGIQQGKILENKRQAEFRTSQLQSELARLRNTLTEIRTAQNQRQQQAAIVHVSISQAGNLRLQLNYMVAQVSWQPAYEARLASQGTQLQLTYFGDIRQNTQEDWEQARLSLSTATPMVNAAPPPLQPWLISEMTPPPNRPAPAPNQALRQFRNNMDNLAETSAVGGGPRDEDLVYAQSGIENLGISVLFKIPQPVSIRSSNQSRRVAIATRTLECQRDYEIVPRLSPQAYMRVRFTNEQGLPLLPGAVRHFVDTDYTGTGSMALVRSQERATLHFGVDPDIKVQWKTVRNVETKQGAFQDIKRRELLYEAEITNYKPTAQTVQVLDPLPVPGNPQIKLVAVEHNPKPTAQTEDKYARWTLTLQPQEKKTLRMAYVLEYPATMNLSF
jgi:uncharacterized protein (TIGR02231 family)